MCGRFTLTRRDFDGLAAALGADARDEDAASYRPRYNIAPTDPHWIVREKSERRQILPARWGLVNSWAKDAKGAARQINARAESALKRPAFRDAFVERRCVVPADGFFEWIGARESRRPVWFHAPDHGLLLFAGLYESWLDPQTAAWQRTFTILTTDANDVVAPVHDRMPVIVPQDRIDDWIFVPPDGREAHAATLTPILSPAPAGVLVATEVSRRVNAVANDDEACLEPANNGETAASPRLF
ncbi:MAG TPA: SOS response-associated peptidase [Dehalococcoidia bacterium]|nr:SOS response-associated peptidase [Dehalococcoidia bacterium]